MLKDQENYELCKILLETEGDFEYAIEYALLNGKVEMFNFLWSIKSRLSDEAVTRHITRTCGNN
jgi:hypothetical protein